jgi:outer membrane protein OmpA-like peptidoglycan-associated protein/opacity protein-like surface antigen
LAELAAVFGGKKMKLQLLTAVAATAIMAFPSIASADDAGWYVRGNVGYGTSTDIDFSGDLIGDVEGEGNVAGSLGLGYDFGNNWRIEVDGAQLWDDLGAIGQASNTSADIRYSTGMLNALYDFDDFGAWAPYVGAGIGVARSKLSAFAHSFPIEGSAQIANNPACPGTNTCVFERADNGVAWQLIAGLGYDISNNLTWDTQYRYLNVGELDFTGLGANLPAQAFNGEGSVISTTADGAGAHMIMTGLRYKFGAPTPPPPMYTCWNGDSVEDLSTCPAEPPKVVYTTCWDGSQVESGNACPARPQVQCWDGSTVDDAASCPTRPTVTCWDGSIAYDQASCPVQTYQQSLCAQEYRQEIVYYEFNKPQSAETRDKIQRILDTDQYCAVGNITVVGHTDSSGSAAYNQGLSERRAADVRRELVRQGVDAKTITSEGKGETQLFIDTGDGVKEALNRRTEVLIRLTQTGVVN